MNFYRVFNLKSCASCCQNCLIMLIGTYQLIFNNNVMPAEIIKAADRMQEAGSREHNLDDKKEPWKLRPIK